MKRNMLCPCGILVVLLSVVRADAAPASRLASSIEIIRAVGPEGLGNAEAARAWKKLGASGPESIPMILSGMDGANDLAVNWLRAAVETIAGRERGAGRPLPMAPLEAFVRDARHHPRARRMAYELIAQDDPQAAQRLIAGLRDDPGAELRREAVQRLADDAAALRLGGKTNEAIPKYLAAIESAREADQVENIAKELKRLGHPVELASVFGWVKEWRVIGPFDSTGGAGHDRVYPPEQRIDPGAEYDGKTGKVRWQDVRAAGDYGVVDFNKPCGALKEVAGYAYAEFHSERERPVELRLGCKNAWKVWLNGKFLFGRDEYHRGMEIDQYRMTDTLKPGKNIILVKLCQNEMKEDWTKEWEFQLRVTDTLGTPIPSVKP